MQKSRVFFVFILLTLLLVSIAVTHRIAFAQSRVVNVSTAAALSTALTNAQPGDVIQLADGTYSGHFVASVSGTSAAPITLTGSVNAILSGGDITSGYAFHLNGANYWHLVGFHVTDAQKGVVVDKGTYNVIDTITVDDIGDEGIHLRSFSSHNTIQNCNVIQTGLYNAGFGEGIYLGSAQSNWATYSNGQPDTSDYNQVLNNHVGPSVTAEEVDVKEGTTGGLISGNSFDGTGMSGANSATSWVNVKGNNYTISNNTGIKALQNGFSTHIILSPWGENNVFEGNTANVGGPGYGFNIQLPNTGNIVYDNNVVTNAASGVSNIPLTPFGSATPTSNVSLTPSTSPTNTRTLTFVPPTVTATNIVATLTPTHATTSSPATNTPTVPTATTNPNTAIQAAIQGAGTDNTQETAFNYTIKNAGSSAVSGLSVQIYFTVDGTNTASNYALEKYYDQSGVATTSGPTQLTSTIDYFTVSYGTATLAAGASWQYQTALHLSNWGSTYDGSNDWYHTGYTVGSLPTSYTNTNYLPAFVNGTLVWGLVPGSSGTAVPTNTPASATNTALPTSSFTPTVAPDNTATTTPVTPTKTNTALPTVGTLTSTPIPPTKTNTPNLTMSPTNALTNTPNASGPCASPTVITGGGSFTITTATTCFKYVNTSYKFGGMFSVMNGNTTAINTVQWYGGLDQNVTSCANQNKTISGNGGQLNNFTVAKDANAQMFLTITGTVANTISISIQNWQNGSGCSVAPTVHP